jgi:hypothetical protein
MIRSADLNAPHAAPRDSSRVGDATYWQSLQSISTKSLERWVYFVAAEPFFFSD